MQEVCLFPACDSHCRLIKMCVILPMATQATCKACSAPAAAAAQDVDHMDACGLWAQKGLCSPARVPGTAAPWWWVAAACPATCGQMHQAASAAGSSQGAAAAAQAHGSAAPQLVMVGEDAAGRPSVSFMDMVSDGSACEDTKAQCGEWVAHGECTSNPGFMASACPRSCGTCPSVPVVAQPLRKVGLTSPADPLLATTLAHLHTWYLEEGSIESTLCEGGRSVWPPPYATYCMAWQRGCHAPSAEPVCGCFQRSAACMHILTWACLLPGWHASILHVQVRLNNGVLMPTVGYGCAGLGDQARSTVAMALEAGFRHLDSAQASMQPAAACTLCGIH